MMLQGLIKLKKIKLANLFLFALLIYSLTGHTQIIITTGTQIAQGSSPEITALISFDLVNNSDTDFASSKLNISLTGTDPQSILGSWVIKRFVLAGSSVKTLNGNLLITSQLGFEQGVLEVQDGSKVLFTGSDNGVEVNFENNSYVDGAFYQVGKGERRFPVGKGSLYAPLLFSNVQTNDEVGVEVIAGDAKLTPDGKVLEIDNTRYWQVITSDPSAIKSKVSLGKTDLSLLKEGGLVVVQSDQTNGTAINLGNEATGNTLISSSKGVTAPILAVGRVEEINLKIRDLITPFGSDNTNDALYIENLDLFVKNTVKLLDRWGVILNKWENYNNNIPNYDFGKLTPGSYICTVECTDEDGGVQKKSQMITVLKTK